MAASTMIDSVVFGGLWSHRAIKALFEEDRRTCAWLEIIAVLAEVQVEFEVIPSTAGKAIATCCRTIDVSAEFLDEVRQGREASGHSMQGLIRAVQVRLAPSDAQWVYAGATVQDVTDTWLMMALSDARRIIEEGLRCVGQALATLARRHRDTPMAGRTHGQQGLPITFGFKVAVWLAEVQRHDQRLAEIASRMGMAQLAGGVGSMSSLGERGLELQRRFAERLGLSAPRVSWVCSRDVLAEWCGLLAMITATADRIGHEVYNLQRSEIAEVREGFVAGAVGSITMPHKRNPEIAEHLGTLARLVRHLAAAVSESLVHDHERDGRAWKTEWHAVPEVTMMAGRAVELLAQMLSGLEVDAGRMLSNLRAFGGVVISEAVMLALAPRIGRDAAHRLMHELSLTASASGLALTEAVRNDRRITSWLDAAEVEALLDVARHTGRCVEMVDRVLAGST
ncbi:class-II fumarase/aspartase family protein [Methylibium sp.]|uniref:class-II fumarase/aspartase family protein n=1 Tax=Methylibium sp. TaxID=2067992 RepID=UPI003D0EB0CA